MISWSDPERKPRVKVTNHLDKLYELTYSFNKNTWDGENGAQVSDSHGYLYTVTKIEILATSTNSGTGNLWRYIYLAACVGNSVAGCCSRVARQIFRKLSGRKIVRCVPIFLLQKSPMHVSCPVSRKLGSCDDLDPLSKRRNCFRRIISLVHLLARHIKSRISSSWNTARFLQGLRYSQRLFEQGFLKQSLRIFRSLFL